MRRRIGVTARWVPATRLLLSDVPDRISDSWPVRHYGLSEGLSIAAARWRDDVAAGVLPADELRRAIIPVVALSSAMLEALLRGVPIDQRAEIFEQLACASRRVISGRPNAVIMQSGII